MYTVAARSNNEVITTVVDGNQSSLFLLLRVYEQSTLVERYVIYTMDGDHIEKLSMQFGWGPNEDFPKFDPTGKKAYLK